MYLAGVMKSKAKSADYADALAERESASCERRQSRFSSASFCPLYLARRHGGWYAELISAKGQETADGSATAAMVVRYRLDNAPVIVDVGGGYGGGVTIRLKDNGIEPVSFVASWESIEKTKDGELAFANKRAEAWWKFREALDLTSGRLGNRIASRS